MQAKINSSIFYHCLCIHCGCWSPSQLPRGEGGVTPGRVASLSQRHMEKDTRWQSHLWTLLPISPECSSASSLGGGEPVENPCRHSGNMQTPHRARGLGMFTSCDWIRTWNISEPKTPKNKRLTFSLLFRYPLIGVLLLVLNQWLLNA